MEEFGCPYCWDMNRKKEKAKLWFFDAANNYRECDYCPKCGRHYGEVPINEHMESKSELE